MLNNNNAYLKNILEGCGRYQHFHAKKLWKCKKVLKEWRGDMIYTFHAS
jgi:hypothetical protein